MPEFSRDINYKQYILNGVNQKVDNGEILQFFLLP